MKPPSKTLRGVNLGGWLVLEKWMTPELYQGFDALDEYHLLKERKTTDWLVHHRDTFITEEDFIWLKNHHINVVRLPVGWWLFEDSDPYINAEKWFFKALNWAKNHGIDVVVDVHAAPGCQNGFDNGGLQGIIDWPKDGNIDKTLAFIKTLALNIKNHDVVTGFQLINEPHITLDLKMIEDFYLKGYEIVRSILKPEVSVIFHDGFRLDAWDNFFKNHDFENVYLDTHMYHVFGDIDQEASMEDLSNFYIEKRLKPIQKISQKIPLIIGEWSNPLLSEQFNFHQETLTKKADRRWLFNQQLSIYNQAHGWFFWSYKLSKEALKTHPGWSFRFLVENLITPFNERSTQ